MSSAKMPTTQKQKGIKTIQVVENGIKKPKVPVKPNCERRSKMYKEPDFKFSFSKQLVNVLLIEQVTDPKTSASILEGIASKKLSQYAFSFTVVPDKEACMFVCGITHFDVIMITSSASNVSIEVSNDIKQTLSELGIQTPIILLYDRYDATFNEDMMKLIGYHGVLPKPFKEEELCLVLKTTLAFQLFHTTMALSEYLFQPINPEATSLLSSLVFQRSDLIETTYAAHPSPRGIGDISDFDDIPQTKDNDDETFKKLKTDSFGARRVCDSSEDADEIDLVDLLRANFGYEDDEEPDSDFMDMLNEL